MTAVMQLVLFDVRGGEVGFVTVFHSEVDLVDALSF
jgi:hypothetical protein